MIKRVRVTRVGRVDDRGHDLPITHLWLWEWTDVDGVQRYYETKREAEIARALADGADCPTCGKAP